MELMMDEVIKQFLILMYRMDPKMKRERWPGPGIPFEFIRSQGLQTCGFLSVDSMCSKVADLGVLEVNLKDVVRLAPKGREFAEWLDERGQAALWFESPFGSWGQIPPNAKRMSQGKEKEGTVSTGQSPGSEAQP